MTIAAQPSFQYCFIRRRLAVVNLVVWMLLLPATTLAATARFNISDTEYVGSVDETTKVKAFLGVPFAAAPVGDLRWQAPQSFVPSAFAINVQAFAPACMQTDRIIKWYQDVIADFGGDPTQFDAPQFSEDCLYLNIWAPDMPEQDAAKLPVYVYLHGGSNIAGWSFEPNYVGAAMAQRGMIVVSVAYRLGVFGFFPHIESEYANFAMLDQIAALQWVQEHIAAVGGDPQRVTLAGESAGANNIAVLLGSPMAEGLFQRAVIQSGAWSIQSMPHRNDLHDRVNTLAQTTLGKRQASLTALRTLSAEALNAAAEEVFAGVDYDPLVGDAVMPRSLRAVADARELHSVDVILGSNTNEYLVYLEPEQTVQAWLEENHVEDATAQAIKAWLDDGSSELEQVDTLITAAQFGCPTLEFASQLHRSGARAWVYEFNKVREGELASKMGAYHGAELPYIFDTHDDWLPTNASDRALTSQIADYWAAFTALGEPRAKGLPDWPEYTHSHSRVISLGENLVRMAHPSAPLCKMLGIIE